MFFPPATVKDEIIIGLPAGELKALGGTDASAVAHALAQEGDMPAWQYNVHRSQNGELQQADCQFIAACRTLHDTLRDRSASIDPAAGILDSPLIPLMVAATPPPS